MIININNQQRIQKFLLTCILLGTFAAISLAQKTEYYRHLVFRESPYSQTRGIHKIDKIKAQKETHYRFVYDDQDRLVEISHRIGDFIINYNNNWDSFIWFSPKTTIEYKDGQEIHHFYNRLDQRSEVHGRVYKAVYTLDDKGRRTSVKYYDQEDKPSESTWNIHTYEWTHEDTGTIIEKRFNLNKEPQTFRPDFTFYTVRFEFGDDDLLDFVHHIDDEGKYINNSMNAAMDRIVYDQEGNFSRWMVFDKDMNPAEGNAPEFALGEHLYDARGNKVELRGFDVIGRPKAMPNGVARVLNTYDEFNNQIEVKVLDIQGNTLQHVKRTYSEDGRRIEWIKYLDTEGNLTKPQGAPFAAIQFEYADDTSLSGRKHYDENMKEVTLN